jgi:hypothetical protein
VDEVVERDQGLLEAFLVDFEAVSRHFVVAYPDDATGVAGAGSLLVPSPGDFPSLACLCERRARIGNFPSLAKDGQSIEDVEEDARESRQVSGLIAWLGDKCGQHTLG